MLACAKNSQDERERGRTWIVGSAYILREDRASDANDLSPSPAVRARPGEIILFPKRGPTILLHPHRSPTVELALVVAKVAAGVFEEARGGARRGLRARADLNLIQTERLGDKLELRSCWSCAIYVLLM